MSDARPRANAGAFRCAAGMLQIPRFIREDPRQIHQIEALSFPARCAADITCKEAAQCSATISEGRTAVHITIRGENMFWRFTTRRLLSLDLTRYELSIGRARLGRTKARTYAERTGSKPCRNLPLSQDAVACQTHDNQRLRKGRRYLRIKRSGQSCCTCSPPTL